MVGNVKNNKFHIRRKHAQKSEDTNFHIDLLVVSLKTIIKHFIISKKN